MCGPAAVVPLMIAATAVTAGAQVYSGMAANSQAKYEAAIDKQNAALEQKSINDAQQRRAIAQQQNWRKVAANIGMQRAQAAALGLDTDFGSPGDLQHDTMMIGLEDSATLNRNFDKEVKGYDINAANDIMAGRAAKARGRAALIGSGLQAAGTILGGATQIGEFNAGRSNFSTNFGS